MSRGIAAALLLALSLAPARADAVSVRITADKDAYAEEDTARLLVTVENNSDQPATDLSIENLLPKGLKYAPEQGETAFSHEAVAPHSRVEHTLLVQRDPRVSVSERGGVRVTLEADKDAYADGDTARLRVTVENLTDAPVRDVDIANLLPKGLKYAPEQKETAFSHEMIAPHSSAEHTLLVQRDPRVSVIAQGGAHVTLEAEKDAYADGDTARLLVTVENLTDTPMTGVSIANLLPDGLEYAPEQGETAFSPERVAPGGSVQHTLLVRQRAAEDIPRTGDGFNGPALLAAAAASLAAMLYLGKKRRADAPDEGRRKDR